MNWIISKLYEGAITLFWAVLGYALLGGAFFILFKGYGLLFGPSQEELAKKDFLNEFLKVNQSTWNVIRDCEPSNFSKEYFFKDEYSINCEVLYKRLVVKLEERASLKGELKVLIDNQRPSWLRAISGLNMNLKPDNIEELYNFLEKSAYYCGAASLIMVNGKNEANVTSMCVQIVEVCLNQLFEKNASAENINYPCDRLSGIMLLAQIKSGILN